MGKDGGGGGGPTQSTVTQTNLPEWARPYAEKLFGMAETLTDTDRNPYKNYEGQRTAGFNPMQENAFNNISGMQPSEQLGEASDIASDVADKSQYYQNYAPQDFGNQYQGQDFRNMGLGYLSANAPEINDYQMDNVQSDAAQFGGADNVYADQTYNPDLQKYQMDAADNVTQDQLNGGVQTRDINAAQTGYDPRLQDYQMGNVQTDPNARERIQTGDINAAQTNYRPDLQNYEMKQAQQVGSSNFNQQGTPESYMSPYQQNVIDSQQRNAQRQATIAGNQRSAAATRAGALGGSRSAIENAEASRNLALQQGDIQSSGMQAAYQQAQQQFNADQARNMAAQQANQQAGLTTGQQNLQSQLSTQQLGAQSGMQAALANLNNQQQSSVQNEANKLQASGMNSQQAMQMALANQQAGLTSGQQNLQAQLSTQQLGTQTGMQTALANLNNQQQAAVQNEANRLQASGMNSQQAMQMALANQQNQQQANTQNLGANLSTQQLGAEQNLRSQLANQSTGLQAGLANQQMQYNAGLQNAQLRQQSNLANQQAGLTTNQQNLNSRLGTQQLRAGQDLQTQLANQSAFAQNQGQGLQQNLAGNQQAMQNAQLAAQYGLAGQQAGEQSRQFGSNLGMAGLNQRLAAGSQLGALGQTQYGQRMGITQAQLQAGAQQQALEQQGLTNQYQAFLDRQNYPYQNLSYMSNILRGTPIGSNATSQMYQAPAPISSQLIGAAGGLGSLWGAYNKSAAGGSIKSYADGGGIRGFALGGQPEGKSQITASSAGRFLTGISPHDPKAMMLAENPPTEGVSPGLLALIRANKYAVDAAQNRAKQQPPTPQTTVAQDLGVPEQSMASMRSGGLASMPSGVMNNVQYADGGIIAFAGEADQLVNSLSDAESGFGQSINEVINEVPTRARTPAEVNNLIAKLKAEGKTLGLGNILDITREKVPDIPAAPVAAPTATAPAAPAAAPVPRPSIAGQTLYARTDGKAAPTEDLIEKGLSQQIEDSRKALSNVRAPEGARTVAAYREEAEGINEAARIKAGIPSMKERIDKISAEAGEATKNRDVDRMLALAQGFFAMGAGKSQYAMQNFSAGLGITTTQLKAAEKDYRAAESLRKDKMALLQEAKYKEELGLTTAAIGMRKDALLLDEKFKERMLTAHSSLLSSTQNALARHDTGKQHAAQIQQMGLDRAQRASEAAAGREQYNTARLDQRTREADALNQNRFVQAYQKGTKDHRSFKALQDLEGQLSTLETNSKQTPEIKDKINKSRVEITRLSDIIHNDTIKNLNRFGINPVGDAGYKLLPPEK